MNTVQISGWLARDPEAKYFNSGSVVVTTAVGLQEYKPKDKESKSNFVEIKAWGKTGEFLAQYLKKGNFVMATGRLEVESWEKDGNKRSRTVVVVERLETPPRAKSEQSSFSNQTPF